MPKGAETIRVEVPEAATITLENVAVKFELKEAVAVRFTEPVKPDRGVTLIAELLKAPLAKTVSDSGLAERAKSGPGTITSMLAKLIRVPLDATMLTV